MKILVTGSEGTLMQAVIPKLLAHGHTIVGVDNLYRHGQPSAKAGIDYEFHNIDLTNKDQTLALFNNQFDVVFQAAAKLYGVGGFHHYCADILGDDTVVQSNVLRGCATTNVKRVVYISSSMVYEQGPNTAFTESMTDDIFMPKTDYGLSKLIGERMCQAFHQQYGLDYTIWRPFNIVNPKEQSMQQQGFSHVIADFVHNLVNKKLNPLPIIGDGLQIRCFTWLDDVATIIANYSLSDKTLNEAVNICNVEPVTMQELANIIWQACGNPNNLEFYTADDYVNDVKVRIPSTEKLQSITDFKFTDTRTIIQRCIQEVTNNE